ncbi:hypothetical protein BDN70DRAFT_990339 [Pholiota conissans]|uniref:Zn(2)-C6 fungal-type domain-containing protein n=1 Tax=Pholiota conissans TaxID=109636 RepID=A0A9P5ZAU9_9AGAR|nr:hypothetical protein BDN70DRAFT_990339 [Pholiota conissans]
MDGHDDDSRRESSLPRSLIPHLYRHPPNRDSSTRTTLYRPDIPLPPLPPPRRPAWSEGEAGPSSGVPARYRRRPGSISPLPDPFARPPESYAGRDPSYLILPGPPIQPHHPQQPHHFHQPQPYYPHQQQNYHANDLVLLPDINDGSHFSFRHDPYLSVANLSLHTPPPPPTHFRSPSSAGGSHAYRSDSYSDTFVSIHGDDDDDNYNDNSQQQPKRRRAESLQDSAPRKQQLQATPRKTAVACNFCRGKLFYIYITEGGHLITLDLSECRFLGRKLRCNGARPICSHCAARQIHCEYVSAPKRRGPGKAKKGSRTKKAGASRLDPSGSNSNNNIVNSNDMADRPSSSVQHQSDTHTHSQLLPPYEINVQGPEMRPYTQVMSMDTLDLFSFEPPAQAPRYPSGDVEEMMMRRYYSRTRSPRRRETSSEDRSGAEWE